MIKQMTACNTDITPVSASDHCTEGGAGIVVAAADLDAGVERLARELAVRRFAKRGIEIDMAKTIPSPQFLIVDGNNWTVGTGRELVKPTNKKGISIAAPG
jgi:tRNA pseudouridine-54 N-methylase